MERSQDRPGDGPVDQQILELLQHHRRLTFLSLADSLPAYTWHSLFVALNRLSHQQHVELMPLPEDYEVVWRHWRTRSPVKNEKPCNLR
jgi:hypothetical protein